MSLAKTGFGSAAVGTEAPIDARVAGAVRSQLSQYGWDQATIDDYVQSFMERRGSARLVADLCAQYQLAGKDVLEVGSGLGNLLVDLARHKVRAVGVEPGEEWCAITRRRLEEAGDRECRVLMAVAEALPFGNDSFDFIISMEVLEHVGDPARALAEMHRVLRPGGTCVVIAPNYFSFFETHYRVAWLPGLPARLGAWYLRARGRDPRFYLNHVNNVTFARAFAIADRLPWTNVMLEGMQQKLRRPELVGSPLRRALVSLLAPFGPNAARAVYWATNLFRADISCVFRK